MSVYGRYHYVAACVMCSALIMFICDNMKNYKIRISSKYQHIIKKKKMVPRFYTYDFNAVSNHQFVHHQCPSI